MAVAQEADERPQAGDADRSGRRSGMAATVVSSVSLSSTLSPADDRHLAVEVPQRRAAFGQSGYASKLQTGGGELVAHSRDLMHPTDWSRGDGTTIKRGDAVDHEQTAAATRSADGGTTGSPFKSGLWVGVDPPHSAAGRRNALWGRKRAGSLVVPISSRSRSRRASSRQPAGDLGIPGR